MVQAALALVKQGTIYDLGVTIDRTTPEWPGHAPVEVVIDSQRQTDFPRFSRISVRDDGNGLTVKGLANLIHHIGGSPKRTKAGVGLGVVNKDDPSLSPGGRRLIGKIGIGLFSVAQLTRHFQIITKTKGSKHRLVAEVMLKTYTEGDLATLSKQDHVTFETGIVRIRAFPGREKGRPRH